MKKSGKTTHRFITNGTCSSEISFDIDKGKIKNLKFERGCDGNLKAISILAEGSDALEIAKKLEGIKCGLKPTSCADQLATAIQDAVKC